MKSTINVKLLRDSSKLPSKSSINSAGFDLYAAEEADVPACSLNGDGRIEIGEATISIGIAIQLPIGTVGRLASRSGLSIKYNIEVGAGWIDNDYRGEIFVKLRNFGSYKYHIDVGDRVAQLIVLYVADASIAHSDQLDDTARGTSGFGSSGR